MTEIRNQNDKVDLSNLTLLFALFRHIINVSATDSQSGLHDY